MISTLAMITSSLRKSRLRSDRVHRIARTAASIAAPHEKNSEILVYFSWSVRLLTVFIILPLQLHICMHLKQKIPLQRLEAVFLRLIINPH